MKAVLRLLGQSLQMMSRAPARRPAQWVSEALESRRLLTAVVTTPLPNLTVAQDSASQTFDLINNFTETAAPGTVVEFKTSLGTVDVELTDQKTPATVANFLQYVNAGIYNNSLIHRTVSQPGLNVVQGGGFSAGGSVLPSFGTVPGEFSQSNVAGTIAMALSGFPADVNSGTNEWFFNTTDNSAALDPQGFTVFGHVVSGLNVLTHINALPTVDASNANPAFASLPVLNAAAGLVGSNLITVTSVTVLNKLTFNVSSDDTNLVTASVSGNVLTVNTVPGKSGYAHIHVAASSLLGTQTSDTFTVKVTAGDGRTMDVAIGRGAGPSGLSFVDSNHTVGQISISGPGQAVVHFGGDAMQRRGNSVRGGDVQVESISFTGTTIATNITILGHGSKGRSANIGDITTDGALGYVFLKRTNLLGNLTAAGAVRRVNIASAQGGTITLGAPSGRIVPTIAQFGLWVDENLASATPLSLISGIQWFNSSQAGMTLTAPYVRDIRVLGSFTPGVQLSAVGAPPSTIRVVKVGGLIGGTWNVPGRSPGLIVGGTSTDWNATFTNLPFIRTLGQFGGSLTAPSLQYIKVRGAMSGASINLTANTPGRLTLGLLYVKGAITQSSINSVGSIGSITAGGLQSSIVYAGVGPLASGQALPTSASDFQTQSTIRSIAIHPRGKNAVGFVNSDIAAATLGSLALGTTNAANNGNTFGVAAHKISSFSVKDLSNKHDLSFSHLSDAATLAAIVAAKHLNLQDLVIRLI